MVFQIERSFARGVLKDQFDDGIMIEIRLLYEGMFVLTVPTELFKLSSLIFKYFGDRLST